MYYWHSLTIIITITSVNYMQALPTYPRKPKAEPGLAIEPGLTPDRVTNPAQVSAF